LENKRAEQILPRSRGGGVRWDGVGGPNNVYTLNKCKNDKIKFKK
jgi:hypothetical protein